MFMDSRYMLDRETSSARSLGSTLWRLGTYFAPYWPYVLVAFVLVCAVAGSQAYTAILIGQAIDCYVTPAMSTEGAALAAAAENCRFAGGDTQGWSQAQLMRGLRGLIIWTAGIFILSSLSRSLGFYTMAAAGNRVVLRIRVELFARLHSLSMGYYHRHDTGDVMSRLTNDLDTLQQNLNFMMVSVVLSIISVVWIAAQMLILNLLFGLMSLAVMPLMYVIAKYLSAQARREFRKARREIGNINADLQENIAGIRELQALAREGARYNVNNLAGYDVIVTGCASCTLALKDYGKLLQGEPEERKARHVSQRVKHIAEYVLELAPRRSTPTHAKRTRKVTYHSSCHLRAAGVTAQPRHLLATTPGLEYVEMQDADRCAGGAGTYIVKDYDAAQKIFERKRRAIEQSGADIVATSCPACMIQLKNGLRAGTAVKHIAQILDESIGEARESERRS